MPLERRSSRVKPLALHPGDTIAIVAPASSFKRDEFSAGCEGLRGMGYEVVYDESIFDRDLYFAGSAERRARELERMFAREEVKAILCARGGYGSNYLLPQIDLNQIAAHPKIFVAYSDLTSLLTYFCDAGGLVVFHGPMVAKDFATAGGIDLNSWQTVLGGNCWQAEWDAASGVKSLAPGSAEGVLYGGCLSLLVASLGTPYEIDTEGTILFVEDLAEKPYQIDRMLMQLKLAGKFANVRGIIFGEMLGCVQSPNQGYTLEEVVMRVVGNLGVPVAYGLRSGHVSRGNTTLPFGVNARLEVGGSTVAIKMLESATV